MTLAEKWKAERRILEVELRHIASARIWQELERAFYSGAEAALPEDILDQYAIIQKVARVQIEIDHFRSGSERRDKG